MSLRHQKLEKGFVRHGQWKVELGLLLGWTLLALWNQNQASDSFFFTLDSLIGIAPYLLVSIGLAAYAKSTGADNLIARAFSGRESMMILFASLMGGLSPFCSCGVIPLIAALLSMGVPLAPVMAFWLSSPLMDPSMFFLTAGTLGLGFALYKTFAAVAVGLIGGFGIFFLIHGGGLSNPLREGVGSGGCGGNVIRNPKQVVWKFWREEERRTHFGSNALENLVFLGKYINVAAYAAILANGGLFF